ncbi:hypothetical protein [Changchengzhania lutea]|uniref:hypothetical protein n=1 Tax=Changchengzhania lutea TaxID=2049305 RepID=UPI00115DDCEA|nr:hypothetical protein [Changchengzhania lutea]
MIEDELIKIWQSASNQERLKFEKSKLMIELESSLGRLHKWWKYVEISEVVGAIIAIPLFLFIVFTVPYVLSKIAAALIVVWLIYLLIRILSVKKFKPSDLNENYVEYLNRTKEYITVQKRLLDTSLYWYILPSLTGVMLFVIGISDVPKQLLILIFMGIVVFGAFIYFLNKRRVRKEIIPRIEKVENLIKAIRE